VYIPRIGSNKLLISIIISRIDTVEGSSYGEILKHQPPRRFLAAAVFGRTKPNEDAQKNVGLWQLSQAFAGLITNDPVIFHVFGQRRFWPSRDSGVIKACDAPRGLDRVGVVCLAIAVLEKQVEACFGWFDMRDCAVLEHEEPLPHRSEGQEQ
jgi:hypothetical protein